MLTSIILAVSVMAATPGNLVTSKSHTSYTQDDNSIRFCLTEDAASEIFSDLFGSKKAEEEAELLRVRQSIVDYAHEYMGVPYRWGGATPNGFDCSGFVYHVFKKFDIEVPRVSRYQQREALPIDFDDLRPGDLVFFSGSLHVNHVGIVIRNEDGFLEMIHASTSLGVSVVEIYSSEYWGPRLHSGGGYLELYDFIEANPQLAEQATNKENEDIMKLPEVREYAESVEQRRRRNVRVAFAAKAGTTGLGGEVITEVFRGVHLRAAVSGMSFSTPLNSRIFNAYGESAYSALSASILTNIHLTNRWYLTLGGSFTRSSSTFSFSDDTRNSFRWLTISPDEFDDLNVKHEVEGGFYPYAGMGYGRLLSRSRMLYLSVEAGLMYHGGIVSTLSSESLEPDVLQEQQELLRDSTRQMRVLPVINFQFSFRLF